MVTELLFYIGGLALLDTLSPTIIGVTLVLILANDKRNLLIRLLSYLLPVVILYLLLGVMMMLGINYFIEIFSSIFQNKLFSWTIFIIGAFLFVASFFITPNKKQPLPTPKTNSSFSMVFIGIITFFIEASTALPYFTAIGLLTTNDLAFSQWLPILTGYNIIMVSPAIIIYLLDKIAGSFIHRPFVNLKNKVVSSSHSTLSWILCIVGLILIFNTLDYL